MKNSLLCLLLSMLTLPAMAQVASPNSNGIAYGHMHLNVSDIELHKQLWVDHFNGEVIEKGPLTAIKFPNMFVILTEREPTAGSRETVMDHFGFKVRDIDSFLEKWRAAGLDAGNLFIGAEGQSNAYVMFPDDVYVELQEDQGLSQEITGYHIHFYLPEPEELLNWYTNLFDLEIKPRGSISTTTNVPGLNISFARTETTRLPTRGSSVDHIGFEIRDLKSYVDKLEAQGITMDVPYRDVPAIGLKIAFFTDPSGVLIELTEGLDDF